MAEHLHSNHRQRMRARFIGTSPDTFQDHELLEMLLFCAIPRRNTNDISHQMLECFGNLEGAVSAGPDRLKDIDATGKGTADFLGDINDFFEYMRYSESNCEFKDFNDLERYFSSKLSSKKHETLMFMFFDKTKQICREFSFEFYEDKECVDVKTALEAAVCNEACYAAVAYNRKDESRFIHDSESLAAGMKEILSSLRIWLLDFYIVADGECKGMLNCGSI